jgi:putative FmdB family regulatory protein
MPTYRYRCSDCGNEFDQYQKFADDPLTTCPTCEGKVRRVIQPVGVVFKGSGWYITDSRPSNSTSNGSDGKLEKADKSDKSESTTQSDGNEKTSKTSEAQKAPEASKSKEKAAAKA